MSNEITDLATPTRHPATDFFWDATREHRLELLRCDECEHFIHPPRPVCRFCLSMNLSPQQISGRGVIYSFTIVEKPAHPWLESNGRYLVAAIELEEQSELRFLSNIVDIAPDDVVIGMEVEVDFVDVSPDLTLPVFRPGGTS
jgi:uncharacterized protein